MSSAFMQRITPSTLCSTYSDGVKDTDGKAKAKAKDISHEAKTKAKDLTLKAKAKAKDIQHKSKSLCHMATFLCGGTSCQIARAGIPDL